MEDQKPNHRWFRYYVVTVAVTVVGLLVIIYDEGLFSREMRLSVGLLSIFIVFPLLILSSIIALIVRFRDRIRFSLRTLLVVVTLVAALTAFTLNRRQRIEERRAALVGVNMETIGGIAPWHLGIFGGDGYQTIVVRKAKTGQVEYLRALFPESRVIEIPD